MLAELRVRDLAVIADARLELAPGLNVLTGETGAGKSLLVDALALLLGHRADSALVRRGAARAVVEGAFDLGQAAPGERGRAALGAALERLGIEPDDGRLILKREVQAGGRSRAWINGSPATVGVLAELGGLLVDLHGQHDAQSLLRPEAQRAILDAFADAEGDAAAVAAAFDELARLVAEQDALRARQGEARRRADYLRHVAGEIRAAAPKPDELALAEAEVKRLSHAEELRRSAGELAELLGGDERAAAEALGAADRLLAAIARIDAGGTAGWREMLEAARLNVDELARAVRDYADGLESDPARLARLEARRDLLYRLDQKYGPGLERVLQAGEEAGRELELLDTAEADAAELGRRIAAAGEALGAAGRALSRRRRTAAGRLGAAVTRHLAGLGLGEATASVALDPLPDVGRSGAERVEFRCVMNPGLGERPVARAASGGELSRLMLALKVELARHDRVPVLVFDEVDTGIGGRVADRVADALASVAEAHQVLVVTHLPQIAAAAARHFVVAKAPAGGLVATDVAPVHGEDRVEEVARMLGGAPTTARRHAAGLLRGG